MPTTLAATQLSTYLPILFVLMIAGTFAGGIVILTRIIGPRRAGDRKGETYECGMTPIATARKRFNVRFYLIAMVFLVFDVEVIFLYPWASTFTNLEPRSDLAFVWLMRIFFFLFTTIVAYLYGYRKGVFRFD